MRYFVVCTLIAQGASKLREITVKVWKNCLLRAWETFLFSRKVNSMILILKNFNFRFVAQPDMALSDCGTWDTHSLFRCTISNIHVLVNPALFTVFLLINLIYMWHWINVWVWSPSLIPPALHRKQIITITRLSIIVEKNGKSLIKIVT